MNIVKAEMSSEIENEIESPVLSSSSAHRFEVSTDSGPLATDVNHPNEKTVALEKEVNEVITSQTKRKRIHMDSSDCFDRAETSAGAISLTNPHEFNGSVHRGKVLVPRERHKRRKLGGDVLGDQYTNRNFHQGFHNTNQGGFVSASDMYKLHVDTPTVDQKPSASIINKNYGSGDSNSRHKQSKNKQIPNQGSILSFMKSSSTPKNEDFKIKKEAESEEDVLPGSQGSVRSVMYSPIKKVVDTHNIFTSDSSQSCSPLKAISSQMIKTEQVFCDNGNVLPGSQSQSSFRSVMYSPIKKIVETDVIYISDSSCCSPMSSQSSVSSQKEISNQNYCDNAVVKKLFAGQKNLCKSDKSKKPIKSSKTNKKSKTQNIKKEIDNIFNADSFDLDAALSDKMEGECLEVKKTETINDKYGLLGSGSYPKVIYEKINYFERLPFEVLENIFCQLPMLDLCLNSNRVCLQWNSIIADEKFVPWKKIYHKLKKNLGTTKRDVQAILTKNKMTSPANFLLGLIRYMKDFKPVTASNMLACLKRHSKYHWASSLIEERAKECIAHEDPNPWSIITTLIIISHDVYDIQEVIHCLTVPSSECTSKEVIECLYCVSTFLYAFKLVKNDVWNGMHYRLFYALYLFENTSTSNYGDLQPVTSSSKGQQSLVKYSTSSENVRLTHEQLRIVKHQTRADEIIKIVAFAGTGKTTTLVKYTQLRPDKKFLLVVYNKSVCEYAKTKFPHNVTCKTGHGLAFQHVGRRYATAKKLRDVKVYAVTQALPPRKGENLFIRAKNVLTTIENYLASADDNISYDHTPDFRMNERTGLKEQIDQESKMYYVDEANLIWKKMKDYDEKRIGMSHDGYLKMYQLYRPSLRGYDCILIDEAQDLTPAITHILLNQPQGKILVGDPHQQIYSFRGAVNSMDTVRADTIFYLTQSFRFGPEIAQVAASCLEILKKEKSKTLVGSGKKCTIMGDKIGQLAIICRSNFTVFSEAVKKCCFSDEPCKVAFVGGTSNFGFPMLMDIYALMLPADERLKEGYHITHPLIKMFKSFGDLTNFASKAMDKELEGKIKIVKTYGNNLPLYIRKIESKCVGDERQADYVFSTAHKAKGLEFSTVRVTDDYNVDRTQSASTIVLDFVMDVMFDVVVDNGGQHFRDEATDEENLLYVAVTRAKNALQMSPTIMKVLNHSGEKFTFPSLSEDLRTAGMTFKCSETDQEFKPKALTLQKKTIKLGDGTNVGGQMYSPDLLSEDFGSFSQLFGLARNENEKIDLKKKQPTVDVHRFYRGNE